MSTVSIPTSTPQLTVLLGDLRKHPSERTKERILDLVSDRVEKLTRKLLRDQRVVARWDQTADIAQMARIRLWKALDEVPLDNSVALMGLTAQHIRWLIIDRARKHRGPHGVAANHATQNLFAEHRDHAPEAAGRAVAASAQTQEPGQEIEALHEAVDRLPEEQRRVVDLVYYHGMTYAQAADLLQVSEKTVQRRNKRAHLALSKSLQANPSDDT